MQHIFQSWIIQKTHSYNESFSLCFTSQMKATHVPGSRGARDSHRNKQLLCGRMTWGGFCTNLTPSKAGLSWWQLGGVRDTWIFIVLVNSCQQWDCELASQRPDLVTNRQETDFCYFLDLNFEHHVKLKKLEISQAKDVPSQVQWTLV